jgi:hypothetical protein
MASNLNKSRGRWLPAMRKNRIVGLLALLLVSDGFDVRAEQSNSLASPLATTSETRVPPGLEVISNRWRAQNLGGGMSPPPMMVTPATASPPPGYIEINGRLVPAGITNVPPVQLNEPDDEAKPGEPHNAMEKWLFQKIAETKSELRKTGLDSHMRQFQESMLNRLRGQLQDQRAQVQKSLEMAEAMRTNPATAWMHMPDPIEQGLSSSIARYERELADPALSPGLRESYASAVIDLKQKLEDHQTNAQLWADLRLARQTKDAGKISRAEHGVADYLAAKIGKPSGMGLDAVMKEYKKQTGGSHWFNRPTIIRAALVIIFLLPPLVLIFFALRKRRST